MHPCDSRYLSLIQVVPSSILLIIGSVRGGTTEETGLVPGRFKLILLVNFAIQRLLSVVVIVIVLLIALEVMWLIEHHHHGVARITLPMGCIQILMCLETTRGSLSHS